VNKQSIWKRNTLVEKDVIKRFHDTKDSNDMVNLYNYISEIEKVSGLYEEVIDKYINDEAFIKKMQEIFFITGEEVHNGWEQDTYDRKSFNIFFNLLSNKEVLRGEE